MILITIVERGKTMSEFKKVRVDRYFDEEMELVSPLDATYRYIDLFDFTS